VREALHVYTRVCLYTSVAYMHVHRNESTRTTSVVSTMLSMSLFDILFAGAAYPIPIGLHLSAPLPENPNKTHMSVPPYKQYGGV
jgi:hypothetical protein